MSQPASTRSARSGTNRRVAAGGARLAAVFVLITLTPVAARAQESRFWDELALWAEFIYTVRAWDNANWVVTPSVRTD